MTATSNGPLPRRVFESRSAAVGMMLILAFAVRAQRIEEPPLDFAVTRQYRGALVARALYYRTADFIPEWQRSVARANRAQLDLLEPPVLEVLSAVGYHLSGGERLGIPRALSAAFWVLGAIPLFALTRRFASAGAALCALSFYLFVPFGIIGSRSVQPDPLMTTLFIASLLAVVSFHREPSLGRLLVAGLVSACAVFVKPMCVFPILAASFCLHVHAAGLRATLTSRRLATFVALAVAPYALWSGAQLAHPGLLRGVARMSLSPHLYFLASFWRGWLTQIDKVVGVVPFLVSLIGVGFARGQARALLAGLWIGYVFYGLAFPYQIHTHGYYHLQLIPIAALSASPLIAAAWERLAPRRVARFAAAALLAVAAAAGIGKARQAMSVEGGARRVRMYEEIGRVIDHSTQMLCIAENYGRPLRFHGHLAGSSWPTSVDFRADALLGRPVESAEDRLKRVLARHPAAYFVVTQLDELERQPELKRLLAGRYSKLAETDEYLIYDLHSARQPPAVRGRPGQ